MPEYIFNYKLGLQSTWYTKCFWNLFEPLRLRQGILTFKKPSDFYCIVNTLIFYLWQHLHHLFLLSCSILMHLGTTSTWSRNIVLRPLMLYTVHFLLDTLIFKDGCQGSIPVNTLILTLITLNLLFEFSVFFWIPFSKATQTIYLIFIRPPRTSRFNSLFCSSLLKFSLPIYQLIFLWEKG